MYLHVTLWNLAPMCLYYDTHLALGYIYHEFVMRFNNIKGVCQRIKKKLSVRVEGTRRVT